MPARPRLIIFFIIVVAAVVLVPDAGRAEIRFENLTVTRSVTEGDWLNLKLEVLGLRLSYPAYRVSLHVTDHNVIAFDLFLSTPLAQHLEDAGRGETERVLSYHAEGILNQVMTLLREDFPEFWPEFDSRHDFVGLYLKPGEEFDTSPQEVGFWREDRFRWRE